MHLKTYLVYMFLRLQFLPLPEIVALDSKQSNALSWVGGGGGRGRTLGKEAIWRPQNHLEKELSFCVA